MQAFLKFMDTAKNHAVTWKDLISKIGYFLILPFIYNSSSHIHIYADSFMCPRTNPDYHIDFLQS
jgi:hypothetical protein